MLVLLGTFSLKLAIDDYVHFQRLTGSATETMRSLVPSLVIYRLLAASIACAATRRVAVAELLLSGVMVIGLAWIIVTKASGGEKAPADKLRHVGWIIINTLMAVVLVGDAALPRLICPDLSLVLLYGLTGVVVIAAIAFRTFGRLADLNQAPPGN